MEVKGTVPVQFSGDDSGPKKLYGLLSGWRVVCLVCHAAREGGLEAAHPRALLFLRSFSSTNHHNALPTTTRAPSHCLIAPDTGCEPLPCMFVCRPGRKVTGPVRIQ